MYLESRSFIPIMTGVLSVLHPQRFLHNFFQDICDLSIGFKRRIKKKLNFSLNKPE